MSPNLPRRGLLAGAGAFALPFPQGPSLRQKAAAKGLLFGCMVEAERLLADPAYAACVVRECAMIEPGIEAKWTATEPAEGQFDFTRLDALADFADRHGLALRLHNLVWSVWNPAWLAPALAGGRGGPILQRHIETVASHMRGRALAWDVVNEPADPRWPSGPDGLCRTGWWNALGPDYVVRAFALAHQADPAALLFVNDDLFESPASAAKRQLYLRLLETWLRRGVPIHGVGLEAHLHPDLPFDAQAYRDFLANIASLGLIVHITELDVCDRTLPPDPDLRDRIVAATVSDYLATTLDEPAVRAVSCWGLADGAGSLDRDPATRRTDGRLARGLPLDSTLRRKPMYWALADAFDRAPERS